MPNNDTYFIGATQVIVPTGSTGVAFIPGAGVNGGTVKWSSGGTLAIVQSLTTLGASGYALGSTEVYAFSGPARFFLAATGATSIAHVSMSYSAGVSLIV